VRELVLELTMSLRERVLPALGAHAGREHEEGALAAGGDVTFAIDADAETALAEWVERRAPTLARYSEDRGLVLPPAGNDPEHVLIVDPIDGTRPALAGLESACVAVAVAAFGDGDPAMADVETACVAEIKTGTAFLATRGGGVQTDAPVRPSPNDRLDRMFWAYGFRGRPARPTAELLGDLIDASSVGGGTFELGSQCFGMTRIVTGQLDAVIECGSRMVDEVPGLREEFERIGGGAILNNSPYDLAAPALLVEEAGGVVSDGWGRPLSGRPLLGSGHAFQMSSISAANPALHSQLVGEVDAGISRLIALAS
jgi:myo-inositol-1(or 4)-monophosphatase